MIDRVGEVYEWLESGEIFVIVERDIVDNSGDQKWRSVIISLATRMDFVERLCEETLFSEMWFSDSRFSNMMRRL